MPMEITYENVKKRFDNYFKACNKNMGPLETVPDMEKYFTPDLEFWMYTVPPGTMKLPVFREEFLMTMVHPGLHEELTPQYYVIDLKRMVVVAQFQIQFSDENTGKVWLPMQASCHYHLILDKSGDLKIKKIQYWTAAISPDVAPSGELWYKYRDQALAKKKK
jgi:hypothetical protein